MAVRSRLSVATVAGLSALALTLSPFGTPADGSRAQSRMVTVDPVDTTPHLVDDGVVAHTFALAIAKKGPHVYVGGRFNKVENPARTTTFDRSNLFAFDNATGDVSTTFAPNPNGVVWAVRRIGKSVYVGGEFTTISGVTRPALAKLNAATGAVDPNFKPPFTTGRVSEIRQVRGRLIVGGTFPQALLALNPDTGRNTKYIKTSITDKLTGSAGKVEVHRFAVNPQRTRLVAVGNFKHVNGRAQARAFMLNLGRDRVTLNAWHYRPLQHRCLSQNPNIIANLEDVDFSPDGSYFVFAATGYLPQLTSRIGTDVCDAAARFETNITHPTKPTWINYTGGDTLHAVAATGKAVYV
ncbi:MAG TPA: hypothetical protein VNB91_16190, partial [Jatrophihabitantaceae bacterium]|nr:hypothetical protein [Jatrophihabitantaceae bacterium]